MRLVGHGPVPSSVVVWFLVVLNNNDGMGPCSSLLRCVQLSICERNFTSPRPLTVVVALVASFCPRITGQSKRSLRQHCAHNQGVINSTSASRKLCFMRLRFRPLSGKRGNQQYGQFTDLTAIINSLPISNECLPIAILYRQMNRFSSKSMPCSSHVPNITASQALETL